jgi:hypothetical protein
MTAERGGVSPTLQNFLLEVPGWNFGSNTGDSDFGFFVVFLSRSGEIPGLYLN